MGLSGQFHDLASLSLGEEPPGTLWRPSFFRLADLPVTKGTMPFRRTRWQGAGEEGPAVTFTYRNVLCSGDDP